jgi:hypothetical protein
MPMVAMRLTTKGNKHMKNTMTIGLCLPQTNKETGNEFLSIRGNLVVDGKLVNGQLTLDSRAEGAYDTLRALADKFQEAEDTQNPDLRPRGLALEAPEGFSIDWAEERKPFTHVRGPRAGQEDLSPYTVRVIRGSDVSLRIVPAPPLKVDVAPEARELLAKYGI